MISEAWMFLASYGYYGGVIGDSLNRLAEIGFFDYVLPFLLIFALVFGILSATKLFGNAKELDAIIALVVALMALQFDMVPLFFSQVFPRLGVALAIILVILILAGFFIDPKKAWIWQILLGIGIVSAIVVVINSAKDSGFYYSLAFNERTLTLIGVLLFVIIIVAIITGIIKKDPNTTWELRPFRQ